MNDKVWIARRLRERYHDYTSSIDDLIERYRKEIDVDIDIDSFIKEYLDE